MKTIKKWESPFQRDFHDLEKINLCICESTIFFTKVLLIHLIQSSFLNAHLIRWLVSLNNVYIYPNTRSVIYNISSR